jgi:hypothetical protein
MYNTSSHFGIENKADNSTSSADHANHITTTLPFHMLIMGWNVYLA